MGINRTSNLTFDETLVAGGKASGGLAEHEGDTGIKNFTKEVVDASVSNMISKRAPLKTERKALKDSYAELHTAAEAAEAFILKMIDHCCGYFGRHFNSSFEQLGLSSLTLPNSHPYRLGVIGTMAEYLTSHPLMADPAKGITAAIATGLNDAYGDAMSNVERLKSSCRTALEARDAAMRATQEVLRGLINELDSKISSTDPRWRAFGFNCPGDPQVPGQVENLFVSPSLARSLYLEWDAAPRAARYQVEMQLMAPEAEWTLMATVGETNATLTELTPGANVLLRIVAANDGGEAVPSEPVQATVPMAQAA